VKVKALEQQPELLEADIFYYDMFAVCGSSVSETKAYCELFGLDREETLEAIEMMRTIYVGVS
jgi:hypothetical protein